MAESPKLGVRIGSRFVGTGEPVYLIAEAGVNHNGQMRLAHRLVDVAKEAGVDAIKFQCFDPDALCVAGAPVAEYAADNASDQRSLLASLALPMEGFAELAAHAREIGLEFLCTAFDAPSLDRLIELEPAAYKFASTDLTNGPLLARAAQTGKPLILSTGASDLTEIEQALDRLPGISIVLMHCTSAYPTPPEEAHLATIPALRGRFQRPVGFSDHTVGIEVAGLAIAAGTVAVEKHFTTDPSLPGPDQRLSLDPDGLGRLVAHVRHVERVVGKPRQTVFPCEADVRLVAGRSIVAARPLGAGTILAVDDLALKRPGTGIGPADLDRLMGRRLRVAVPADALLDWDMVE